jgi:hypothetical protein
MTTKTIQSSFGARIAAHVDLKSKAAPYEPQSNPFANHTLEQLSHGTGIMKSADQHPARNMAPHGGVGFELESTRIQGLNEGKVDKSAKRMAAMRTRAAKKAEFDRIAESEVKPDPERMTKAWRVVFPMVPIVTRMANGKKRWAGRFLGSVVDDVAQVVLERMAVLLAKSDKDLDLLIRAADELGAKDRVEPDRAALSEAERKDRKRVAKARRWLMGMANNRVQGTLVDLYLSAENLRWENLDIIATVMASINGVGDDPMMSRFKADRAPAFLGTKFTKPGGIDQALLATAINAAITEKGLDLMVEIMLNPDNRESGGAMRWSKTAERIFLATPGGQGEYLWSLVCKATQHHARPKRARADAARIHVRNQFDWLPGFIVEVVDSFDPHFIGWSSTGRRAVMASDFELFYLPDEPEQRQPLQPALRFTTVEEAVAALIDNINLSDGAEFLSSIANA